jgi:hypothetical protein
MNIFLTTTGLTSSIVLNDLGVRTFNHPVSSLDISQEFDIISIINSVDLQLAIDTGYLYLLDSSGGTISLLSELFMLKSTYDSDLDNIVDNSTKLDSNISGFYLDLTNATGSIPQNVIDSSNLSGGGTPSVLSVNGKTGSVTLSTIDISENTNLYFTQERSRNSISSINGITYSNGLLSIDDNVIAGNGLTATNGVLDVNLGTGLAFSGDDIITSASYSLLTTDLINLDISLQAGVNSIQDALTAIDNKIIDIEGDYVDEIIAGQGLTGGGTAGIITLDVQVTNGLEIVNDLIQIDDNVIAGNGLTAINGEISVVFSEIDHNQLLNYDIGQHRIINDSATNSTIELWSSNKIKTYVDNLEATNIAYISASPSNWDVNPINVKFALDELSFRTKNIENGGGIDTDAQISSSSITDSTSSITYVDIPSMTLTTNNIIPRKYLILFSGTFNGTNNRIVDIRIVIDDIEDSSSIRTHKITSGGAQFNITTQAISDNLANDKIIKVQWKIDGGTLSISNRSLIIYSVEGGTI